MMKNAIYIKCKNVYKYNGLYINVQINVKEL